MQRKYLFIVSEYLKIFKSSKEEGKALVLVLYYKLMSKMKIQ